MRRLPQSTAARVAFYARLASDHFSPATGKTIAVTLSKNGGAFANPSAGATNATEIANGWYYVDVSTTDTNTTGPLLLKGTEGTIDNVAECFDIVNANNGGLASLPNAAAGAAGGLMTCTSANVLPANSLNNTAISVDTGLKTTHSGTLQAGSTTTATLAAGASAVDNFYQYQTLVVTAGAGLGQSAIISSYNGTTKVATLDRTLATALDNTSSVRVMPYTMDQTFLRPTTAGRTLDVTATGAAGVDWGNVENQGTAVNLSSTTVNLVNTLTTYTGNTPQTGDSYGIVNSGLIGNAVIASAVNAIAADTNELQTDWTDGGRLDLILDARASQASVDDLPTNAELSTSLAAADDAVLAQVALVKAKTDNLPADPADASDIAAAFGTVNTTLSTIDARLDTEIPAIVTATSAASIRSAVGLAAANLDTQLADLPTAAENAAGLLDLAAGVETGLTLRQALRLITAALAGKISGASTTTVVIRNAVADSKPRITATVDTYGNRSAITVDLT